MLTNMASVLLNSINMETRLNIRWIEIILMLLCFYSCREETTTEVLVSSKTPVATEGSSLSSILSVKRVISLETNDSSLIGGNLNKILKHKEFIYVSFNRTTLLQFDERGKFIRQIGRIGGGPGEFVMLKDFDVTDDHVYISDVNKLLQYTSDGKFIRSIPVDINLFGLEVTENNKILGFVTRKENIFYVFDMDGKHLDDFLPDSWGASMLTSFYYWPYKDGKYIDIFYSANDILVYDTQKEEHYYMRMTDLPDMATLDRVNTLREEEGKNVDISERATYVWPFNSNGIQLYFITHENTKDDGILWGKHITKEQNFAYDCNRIANDITFVPISHFFTHITRSDDTFLSFISPGDLKEAIAETEDTTSPYYAQMKALADSLTEEDNYILVEYEFK